MLWARALSGALLLYASEAVGRQSGSHIIGCVFVPFAASAGLLVLSSNLHGGEALKDLSLTDFPWVTYSQLIPVAIIYAAVLALWFGLGFGGGLRGGRGKQQSPPLFYALFAISVTTRCNWLVLHSVLC